MLPIVIVGRFAGTLLLVKILDCCCKYNSGIKTDEIFFMGFAGLIRGAIAFGLVLRLDHSLPNRGLIVTTALTIVIFTTIFFGFFVGVISKCIKKQDVPTEAKDEQAVGSHVVDDNYERAQGLDYDKTPKKKPISLQKHVKSEGALSEHQVFTHPNLQSSDKASESQYMNNLINVQGVESQDDEEMAG